MVVPSLTAINEAFGFGEKLLGGYITSLPIQVEEEVKTAVRILHGASPSDIPIVESRKEYVVDWNTMTQIGLSKESIPAKYRIINIPFRDEYPFCVGNFSRIVHSYTNYYFSLLFGGYTFGNR